MNRYNPKEIEPKWQKVWLDNHSYQAKDFDKREKLYISPMFPYPSGTGMHTGHAFEHSIVDAIARFQRAHGRNVLNPMGWDAFGLPTENYAIKTGISPREATETFIAAFKNQIARIGSSIDWSREINTSDPEYYRWTQWIFTKLFERGLAYQKESAQWWCPVDKTVLANEQVEGGRCWRCGNEVVKKNLKQWFFKITDYADELLEEISDLDWPEKIKTAQTNWIGRSQGAEIDFSVGDNTITVFTTRPDTVFGATFLVLAPEHKLVPKITTPEQKAAIDAYIQSAQKKSEIERQENREKTGVFTGAYATNPATGDQIPVWIADYVLTGYGTGAIMAVPAHDERDGEFAAKFDLPVKQVITEYVVGSGRMAPREGIETLHRPVVDAIITDGNGKYLLQIEDEHNVHFVGGGIEAEDKDVEDALRREVIEETGFTEISNIKQVAPYSSGYYYREAKSRNQKVWGAFFEATVDPKVQISSEIDEGKHSVEWVNKDDVAKHINWESHLKAWQAYLDGQIVDMNVREGLMVNSGEFDGQSSSEARENIVRKLNAAGVAQDKVQYKMRDWLISRQRYWGAPIPIIHCEKHGAVAVPEKDLPVMLPEVKDYAPTGDGKSVLAKQEDWVNTVCPECGQPAKRETDTMDGYACSSWYLLRYTDPHNNEQAWDPKHANYWSPVDYYVGGDHAVAHLLYVRFWSHVFYDMGLVPTKEPVKKLVYHGYINAEDGTKMSKSKGNVIDPLEVIDQGYGADALRIFLLFLGPISENSNWSATGIGGVYRFLNRIWTLVQEFDETDGGSTDSIELERLMHKTIKRVTKDIDELSFNTAIAALMECVNELYKIKAQDNYEASEWQWALESLTQLIAPLAPHIAEELWEQLGNDESVHAATWPEWNEDVLIEDTLTVAVQVNGKLRGTITVAKDTSQDEVVKAAQADEKIAPHLSDTPKKVIYVPGRILNFVI